MGTRPNLAQLNDPRPRPAFLPQYNRRRPHSADGGRPPTSRVQQVRGPDTSSEWRRGALRNPRYLRRDPAPNALGREAKGILARDGEAVEVRLRHRLGQRVDTASGHQHPVSPSRTVSRAPPASAASTVARGLDLHRGDPELRGRTSALARE